MNEITHRYLLIKQCPDQMRWYRGMIGKFVPFIGIVTNPVEFKSREPEGYINFVQPEDCEVIHATNELTCYES